MAVDPLKALMRKIEIVQGRRIAVELVEIAGTGLHPLM